MRVEGRCDDGVVRPVLRAEILTASNEWFSLQLLVDTGADRTVLSADVLGMLGLPQFPPGDCFSVAGGEFETVSVRTQFRVTRDDGIAATVRGEYAACIRLESLDMSVLGRDIPDLFTLVLDRRSGLAALLGGNHYCSILVR